MHIVTSYTRKHSRDMFELIPNAIRIEHSSEYSTITFIYTVCKTLYKPYHISVVFLRLVLFFRFKKFSMSMLCTHATPKSRKIKWQTLEENEGPFIFPFRLFMRMAHKNTHTHPHTFTHMNLYTIRVMVD